MQVKIQFPEILIYGITPTQFHMLSHQPFQFSQNLFGPEMKNVFSVEKHEEDLKRQETARNVLQNSLKNMKSKQEILYKDDGVLKMSLINEIEANRPFSDFLVFQEQNICYQFFHIFISITCIFSSYFYIFLAANRNLES